MRQCGLGQEGIEQKLRENDLLRYWVCVSLLNWIGAVTLSLLLRLPPRKLHWSLDPFFEVSFS